VRNPDLLIVNYNLTLFCLDCFHFIIIIAARKTKHDETSHVNNFGTQQDDCKGEFHVAIKKQIIDT
jgi:hypothetical protein